MISLQGLWTNEIKEEQCGTVTELLTHLRVLLFFFLLPWLADKEKKACWLLLHHSWNQHTHENTLSTGPRCVQVFVCVTKTISKWRKCLINGPGKATGSLPGIRGGIPPSAGQQREHTRCSDWTPPRRSTAGYHGNERLSPAARRRKEVNFSTSFCFARLDSGFEKLLCCKMFVQIQKDNKT